MDFQSQKIAFEKLFDQFYPRLLYFAKQYVANASDAEELVHDTFISIWEKKDHLTFDEQLKSYLYKALRNKALNFIKKQKLVMQDVEEDFDPIGDLPDPLQQLSKKETEQRIHKAIEDLPPRCKQIFLLSRTENMSYKAIAEVMDLNIKTVENQIGIALKSIRKEIGIDSNSKGSSGLHLPTLLLFQLL